MQIISSTIEKFCAPFSSDLKLQPLMNLASRKSALLNASSYLSRTLKRGKEAREFTEEWRNEPSTFFDQLKVQKLKILLHNQRKARLIIYIQNPAMTNWKTNLLDYSLLLLHQER